MGRSRAVYPESRKKKFGEYLYNFLFDKSLWPESLVVWYEEKVKGLKPHQRAKGLTAALFLEWLAQESKISAINDPRYEEYFSRQIGNWSRWYSTPSRGGDNAALIIALAVTGVVLDENNQPITSPVELTNYLFSEPTEE